MFFAFETMSLIVLQAASPVAVSQRTVQSESEPVRASRIMQIPAREPKPNLPPAALFPDANAIMSTDYPSKAKAEKRSGSTTVRLDITRWGSVSNCMVVSSSGHADLDAQTCAVIASRQRFEPATDANSRATAGSIERTVNWRLDDSGKVLEPIASISRPAMYNADVFPQPPKVIGTWYQPTERDYAESGMEAGERQLVRISLTISEQGSVTGCEVIELSNLRSLSEASCGLAARIKEITPALDVEGKPTTGRYSRVISWVVPDKDADVVANQSSWPVRKPVSMPDLGTGKVGFTLVADADGEVLSCDSVQDGDVPAQMHFGADFCQNAKERGVETVVDDDGSKVGRIVSLELRVSTEKTAADGGQNQPE